MTVAAGIVVQIERDRWERSMEPEKEGTLMCVCVYLLYIYLNSYAVN